MHTARLVLEQSASRFRFPSVVYPKLPSYCAARPRGAKRLGAKTTSVSDEQFASIGAEIADRFQQRTQVAVCMSHGRGTNRCPSLTLIRAWCSTFPFGSTAG